MGHEGHEHDHDHHHDDHGEHHHHEHHHEHHNERRARSLDGCGRVLHVDPIAGAAGDMLVAAFLDLGVDENVIRGAVGALPVRGYALEIGRREKHAISAASFDVKIEGEQPARDWSTIDAMLEAATIDARVEELARHAFLRLGEAEAKIHHQPLAHVHFHEVGGVDAIVDIVGACAAIAALEREAGGDGKLGVSLSAVPLGGGRARGAHGSIPVPAPAALELLIGLPTRDAALPVGQEVELVTPTGAALLRTMIEKLPSSLPTAGGGWPRMVPRAIGYGSGKRELLDRPNVVRLVLGDLVEASGGARAATHVVLETNVDDATGEIAGAAIEALLEDGALDAWAQAITMKKSRPALTLSVLAPIDRADALARSLLANTGSLGVRRVEVSRTERPRRFVEVATRFGNVRVKIADGDGLPTVVHPEMDVCRAIAKAHGVAVREVIRAALCAFPG
jgi:uncharacterized protein (TIGR00299 family) protein